MNSVGDIFAIEFLALGGILKALTNIVSNTLRSVQRHCLAVGNLQRPVLFFVKKNKMTTTAITLYTGDGGNAQRNFIKDAQVGWRAILNDPQRHLGGGVVRTLEKESVLALEQAHSHTR